MGGGIAPASEVVDPLYARGFVLPGAGKPVVLAAVDWCEIRNDAYDRWRDGPGRGRRHRARAASWSPASTSTTPRSPTSPPSACSTSGTRRGAICDPDFHERPCGAWPGRVREGLKSARRVTHVGTGQAKVEKVASNRRYVRADGKPAFDRMSATRDPAIRDQPEGLIDPWLKTLSFWDGDRPVLALSCYATHPMSYYGKGGVSADFVGLARKRRQDEMPGVFQIYASGCSGNVTAGKYNDGSPAQPARAGRPDPPGDGRGLGGDRAVADRAGGVPLHAAAAGAARRPRLHGRRPQEAAGRPTRSRSASAWPRWG